jgi:hypothetical protein
MSSDGPIALLIARQDPPSWLSTAVATARLTLAWTIRRENEYPSRKATRARLEKLAAAIDTVREEMVDFDLAMLLRAGDKFLPNENEIYHGLGDLGHPQRTCETPRRRRFRFAGCCARAGPQPEGPQLERALVALRAGWVHRVQPCR